MMSWVFIPVSLTTLYDWHCPSTLRTIVFFLLIYESLFCLVWNISWHTTTSALIRYSTYKQKVPPWARNSYHALLIYSWHGGRNTLCFLYATRLERHCCGTGDTLMISWWYGTAMYRPCHSSWSTSITTNATSGSQAHGIVCM